MLLSSPSNSKPGTVRAESEAIFILSDALVIRSAALRVKLLPPADDDDDEPDRISLFPAPSFDGLPLPPLLLLLLFEEAEGATPPLPTCTPVLEKTSVL